MKMIQVQLSEDLAEAAQLNRTDPSADAARLLALELFREDKVSLGRAAELCKTPVEAFIGTAELEADRATLKRLQR
jgi:predicted HTH domain antitoxin